MTINNIGKCKFSNILLILIDFGCYKLIKLLPKGLKPLNLTVFKHRNQRLLCDKTFSFKMLCFAKFLHSYISLREALNLLTLNRQKMSA